MVLHTEYDRGHDDSRKYRLVKEHFNGCLVYKELLYYRDLGYEGAVLHETGKTDHDEGSCEQTPSLGLHPAGAVHSCPVDLGVLDQIGFTPVYLENEPVVGMEEKKDPTMLQAPSAIIS